MNFKNLLTIFFAFAFLGAAFAQSPSKPETEKWLVGKLTGNVSTAYLSNDQGSWIAPCEKMQHISFSKNQMRLIVESYALFDFHGKKYTKEILIELNRVSPLLKITERSGPGPIEPWTLYTIHLNSSEHGIVLVESSKNLPSFTLSFNQEDTAQRVAKALSHLIKLNGGKDEPF